MKTTVKLIINAFAVLTVSLSASAQKENTIDQVFERIIATKGVTHTVNQSMERDDNSNMSSQTKIIEITVGEPNFKLFNQLTNAFNAESDKAMFFTSYHPMDKKSALQRCEITQKNGQNIVLGETPNTNYIVITFSDKSNANYRTAYAAEWWDTDDKNIRQGRLIRSYGEKPQTQRSVSILRSFHRSPIPANAPTRSLSDVFELNRQWNLPDSITMDNVMKRFENFDFSTMKVEDFDNWMKQAQQLQEAYGNNGNPTDIPYDGNMDTWMALAMQRGVSKLSTADWHRFFGLLTQKMMDKANKGSKDDLIVSAGIILDLCKNAPLDDDERRVAANRLYQVIEYFDGDEYMYISDMLTLAARKVQKK